LCGTQQRKGTRSQKYNFTKEQVADAAKKAEKETEMKKKVWARKRRNWTRMRTGQVRD
jgi:hypothetical protein